MTNHLNLPGLSKVTEVPEIEGKSVSHCCDFLLDLHVEPILIHRDGSNQSRVLPLQKRPKCGGQWRAEAILQLARAPLHLAPSEGKGSFILPT